ncbi:hypothetical protein SAMN04488029_2640 [Reichenbachiella faecimaris]|uniref:Lipoprotein n=1 Tax=Reichenbachiella faecimaris TaxID=692418 RepID=A0A1W2GHL7_REIFA|nr:hypothetical protein [Reichenbachiella faecimaris]SMD35982.1 hypothetical protein SAMN04488029_2640 [Reichenbachiella faecimaris]
MKLAILHMLPILLSLIACEPQWEEPFKVYKIEKGTHAPVIPKIGSMQSEVLMFTAIFDESAQYKTNIEENQHDVNKLMGFSDCNSMHHDNSARFGWRWLDDQLEIHAYCYVNGERITAFIGTVDLNQKVSYTLQLTSTQYTFQINDEEPVFIKRGDLCDIGVYYMLYPYFGGNEVAPQDISIQIQLKY